MFFNKNYVVNAAGNTRRGVEFLPDYIAQDEKIMLFVFLHGKGEAYFNDGKWNGQAGGEDRLYLNGSPLQWAKDGKLNTIICPVTKKPYQAAILALQGVFANNADPNTGWAVFYDLVNYAVKNFIKEHPEIDPELVAIMGLSAGGGETFNAINSVDGDMYKAALPMSASGSSGITNWTGKPIVWAMHADNDGITSYDDTKNRVKSIHALAPGMAYLETTKTGHGGWAQTMDPWHSMAAGGFTFNFYQLPLLRKNKPGFLFNNSGTGTTTGPATPPTMATIKAVAKVTIKDNIITLDPTGSTGTIGSFDWVLNPSGKVIWDNGRADGGAPVVKTAKAIVDPKIIWQYTLNVYGPAGKDTVTGTLDNTGGVIVQPPVVVPPTTTAPVKIATVEIYKDSAGAITTKVV